MGLFSFITGGTKAAEKVVDATVSGVDKLFYTEEEKADYHRELQKIHLKYIEVAASESTAQSISRRMICLPVVYVWLALIVTGVAVDLAGLGPALAIELAVENMNMPALAAIGFYVGRHMIAGKSAS